MALDEGVLGEVRLVSGNLEVVRHSRPPGPETNPLYVQPGSGRWATDGGTLYGCDNAVVAWAEYCRWFWALIESAAPTTSRPITLEELRVLGRRSLPGSAPLRGIYLIQAENVAIADLADPVSQTRLVASGFPLRDCLSNQPGNFGLCPDLAQAGERLGWEGIRVSSAAWPWGGHTIALFEAGQRKVTNCTLIMTGRATIATAVGARYRDGEKPSWVP
jgi:hypothetical protein